MLTATDKSSTAGASSPETGIVRLWPYVPGVYGRDALYRVWRAMENEGAMPHAFWDRALHPETCGDFTSFIRTFEGSATTVLFMVEGPPGHGLIGCLWLSEIMPNHQAFLSIWMARKFRRFAREASRQAIDSAFSMWNFQQLWAITPWAAARNLALHMGFRREALLPAFCRFPEQHYDVHVLRLTREVWNGLNFSQRI